MIKIDKAAATKIDCDIMSDEKICTKNRACNICYIEVLLVSASLAKIKGEGSLSPCFDLGSIGCCESARRSPGMFVSCRC